MQEAVSEVNKHPHQSASPPASGCLHLTNHLLHLSLKCRCACHRHKQEWCHTPNSPAYVHLQPLLRSSQLLEPLLSDHAVGVCVQKRFLDGRLVSKPQTHLKYAVEVQIPQDPLRLLGLVEPIIERMVYEDLPLNLGAIKQR